MEIDKIMRQKTIWIVGANKECDIVIDEDTISGTHCQLTLEDSTYSIEDLNSTNGVYVNGKQIFEITFVSEHDEIKLGKKVPLQLPNTQDSPSVTIERRLPTTEFPKEITIGRSKNNDIVIEDSQISNNHAILIITPDLITLKDLNSSNGTFIGETKKEISECTVEADDTIYFSSSRFNVSEILNQAGIMLPEVENELPVENEVSVLLVDYRPYLMMMMACIGVLTIVVSLPFLLPKDPIDPSETSSSTTGPSGTPNGFDTSESDEPDENKFEGTQNDHVMKKENAIYALIVSNADQTQYYQAGTAFAIGRNTLLTAGTCKKRIDKVKERYPLVFILQKDLISVSSIEFHPQYALSIQKETAMQKKLDKAASQVEQSPEPEIAEEQLEAAYKNFLVATQESHHYDVAIIHSPQELPSWLSLAEKAPSLQPLSRITLFGSSFDSQAPYISPESGISIEEKKNANPKTCQIKSIFD